MKKYLIVIVILPILLLFGYGERQGKVENRERIIWVDSESYDEFPIFLSSYGNVYCIDENGKWKRIFRIADRTDFVAASSDGEIVVCSDGTIFAGHETPWICRGWERSLGAKILKPSFRRFDEIPDLDRSGEEPIRDILDLK